MKLLQQISSYSIYAYIFMGIVLLFALIYVLIKLAGIGKAISPVSDSLSSIGNSSEELKKKSEKIEHSLKTSIPFFIKIHLISSITTEVIKDFFDTKPKKRSLKKSLKTIKRAL